MVWTVVWAVVAVCMWCYAGITICKIILNKCDVFRVCAYMRGELGTSLLT